MINTFIKRTHTIKKLIALLLFIFVLTLPNIILVAQVHPLVTCSISGSSNVSLGSTVTYNIGPCTASGGWSITCGTIQSSTTSSVTILFNVYGCSSATLSAPGSLALAKTITITWPTLTGGTISNPTQAINISTSPAQITASAATGGDCGIYTYLWYSSPNNTTFTSISGATGLNYQPPILTATTYYKRQATCSGSSVYTTNTATVIVYPAVVGGTASPASQNINYNTAPSILSVSGVSGGNGTYTYQWQSSPNNSTWTSNGGTSSTYTPAAITSTTYYRVAVTSYGSIAYSSSVVVNVYPQLVPGIIMPTYVTIISGSSPGGFDGTPASGGGCAGSYVYQWQSSTNGTSFSNISGATSSSYVAGNLTANNWFLRQVSCNGATAISDTAQVIISSSTPDINFIRERDILKAGVIDSATALSLTSPYDVAQTTEYFDGLGRQIQSVAMQESPLQKDMVSFNAYDALGRETYKYLPYTASTNDGNYKVTAQADAYNFNAVQYPGEQYYYSQTAFEPSPLNRVTTSYPPGLSWVGSERGVNAGYQMNFANDSVRFWTIAFIPGSIPATTMAYAAGELYKNITIDEAGHTIVEYKDMQEKVVLKKVQLSATPGTGHVGWLCTYYVYDDLNNLRFVIPPQVVVLINSNWTISTAIENGLCYRYEYDYRKRMIIKKIPGAGETWMVYDARDRLAMTQDSALRKLEKWLFTKYDIENRPDSTGLITDPSNYNDLSYHQNLASTSISYPAVGSYTNELLTQIYYDDYSWVSTYSAPVAATMATNYTSNSAYFITSYNVSPVYAVNPVPLYITRGMVTGSKKEVLGSSGSQYLYAASFYDDRGRLIQNQDNNYTTGLDTATMQYDFTGKPVQTLLNHNKKGNTAQNHIVLTLLDYDQAFRLKHIWKNIDNAASNQLIDSMQYNELGQLNAKFLGNNLDSMVYNYNIRGWLTGINPNYVAGTTNHYFGMELGYDKSTSVAPGNSYATPEYNGNIEGIVWKSAGSGINRKYDFTYDDVNRLTTANFNQFDAGTNTFDKTAGIDFSVNNLNYDANGNILTMEQTGYKVGGSIFIDQLRYTYFANSNQLQQVYDTADLATTELGDFHYNPANKQSTDYSYEGNGNLTQDNNKAINSITYNYLNLPQLVHMNGEGNITYTYDAGGTKLSKLVTDSASNHTTMTLYVGSFIYQQRDTLSSPGGGIDTLQFITDEEGRTRWAFHKYTNGTIAYKYEYDFYEKDHLGNTRMILSQEKDTSNYLASLEAVYRPTEVQLFNNITNTSYAWTSVPGNSGIPSGTKLAITNPNDSVSKVDYNGTTGQTTGPSLLLKVMSGDTISMAVQSYYNTNTATSTNTSLPSVIGSLASGIASTATGGAEGLVANFAINTSPVYLGLQNFLNNMDTGRTGTIYYPKAYLNWIFLDDQFNYVSSSSGAIPTASATYPAGTLNTIAPGAPLTMPKNGYLYIWVSNETQGWDVFFDNLSVQYKTGPVLEENHYYPFGLTMAGLSDKAVKTQQYPENKYRFNGGTELQNKEFADATGLELYETDFRSLDPQLGRFWQIDPLAGINENLSPYEFAINDPTQYIDPTGLDTLTRKTDLAPVTVIGYKKNCKTCNSPGVAAGEPPPNPPVRMKPSGKILDNVNNGTLNLKQEAEMTMKKFKTAFEYVGDGFDIAEKFAKINGNLSAAKYFGRINTGFTYLNIGMNLKEKKYLDAGIDGLSLIDDINPYVLLYNVSKSVLNSNYIVGGSYLDSKEKMLELLNEAHNANLAKDYEKAKGLFIEAAQYQYLTNSFYNQLNQKAENK